MLGGCRCSAATTAGKYSGGRKSGSPGSSWVSISTGLTGLEEATLPASGNWPTVNSASANLSVESGYRARIDQPGDDVFPSGESSSMSFRFRENFFCRSGSDTAS